MSRFDYVKYDETSLRHQDLAKQSVEAVEAVIDCLPNGRARATAYTKLEECYMWIGKAVRDMQIMRNSGATLQEERRDG